jgi:DNA modification methylase
MKDLVGIPWMVAFALRADGWYLRQDIIWHKPNPMPESVTDRCTKAHEYIFLLAKSEKYFYDQDAIKEMGVEEPRAKEGIGGDSSSGKMRGVCTGNYMGTDGRRNKRSVWSVTTKPFAEAHFATFPEDLIIPCILAGCPEGGTVLDPFMCAGTVAQVCLRAGRQFLGCELNPKYIAIAQARIDAERRQIKLF